MSDPHFTILLPARNGAPYIREAIESVVAQTWRNWRLIVLENASTDDTLAIARSFVDPRIEIWPEAEPMGIHANWHRGTAHLVETQAESSFLTFLGQDDYYYPDYFTKIAGLIRADPTATIYQTMFDLVDFDSDLIRACRPIPVVEDWRDLTATLCWSLRDSYATGPVFRISDYLAVGEIPDLPLLIYSDHLLFMRMTRRGHKACLPTIDFAYRLRRGSTSFSLSTEKVNADVEALSLFVNALREEFADFSDTKPGFAAMTSLLARELFLLNTPIIRHSLNALNKTRIARLLTLYAEISRGVPARYFAGATATPSRLVLTLRRANLTRRMLHQYLVRKF